MSNVLAVFKRDWLRLLKVPAAWVILFGMVFIPPLYAWYNIVGFWNPYGNTNRIRVVVANNDQGTDNALIGKQNLGNQIIDQLKANDQLGWDFASEADAMDQVQAGKAYASIVIPKDFSDNLAGVVTGDGKRPTLEYYVNEKASAAAPKVTDIGASTVDRTVNATFVSTVSKVLTDVINQAANSALDASSSAKSKVIGTLNDAQNDIANTRSTLAKLTSNLKQVPDQTKSARQTLSTVGGLASAASTALANSSTLLSTAQNGVNTFTATASTALGQGNNLLSLSVAQATQGTGIAAGAIKSASQQVGGMLNTAADINQANADVIDTLRNLPEASSEPLKSAIADLERRNSNLANSLDNLSNLNSTIGTTASDTGNAADNLNNATQHALKAASNARSTIVTDAMPQLNSGMSTLSRTTDTMSRGITSQSALIDQSSAILDQLDDTASSTVYALDKTDQALQDVESQLSTLSTDLEALSLSDTLSTLLGDDGQLDASTIADFMLSPTELTTKSVYPVANYGSGMAPLFTSLALWVGAFVLVVIPKLETDNEGITDLTATQGYLGRGLVLGMLAVAQGLVTSIGDLALGIQCLHPAAFIFTATFSSFVFFNIIYALSTTFLHVGKGLCVLLVILQIPGASGLYPIEMMPGFFRTIYPLLPFTYSIDAMRETVAGYYDGNWWHYMGTLLLYAILALILGLAVRPRLVNLNRMFARQLRESDMVIAEPVQLPARDYGISQALTVLADRGGYRRAIERKAARFAALYPRLRLGAIIAGFAVPAILIVVFAFTANTQLVALATWVAWILLIIGFLMVIEMMRDSIRRQVVLGTLDDETIRRSLAERSHLKKHRRHGVKTRRNSMKGYDAHRTASAADNDDTDDADDVPSAPTVSLDDLEQLARSLRDSTQSDTTPSTGRHAA